MKQKFKKYSLVKIADDLGPHMSHFTSGVEAIVMYTYASKYGGPDNESYGLYLKGSGETAWYYENQLTLIDEDGKKYLDLWQEEEDTRKERETDLDWIFENGPNIVDKLSGYSAQALADSLSLGSLWGSCGEGIDYYANYQIISAVAKSYLEKQDIEGWLSLAEELKNRTKQ